MTFGECLTLQRKDIHGDKNQQPYTTYLIFFIISVGLGNITRKTDISYGFKSDHSFLSLEIDKQQLKRGKGFYKLNTSLLLDNNYKDKLQRLILEKSNMHKTQNMNPNLLWELVKSDIRGYSIKYSPEIKKQESEDILKE